jgi:hypothetical protein
MRVTMRIVDDAVAARIAALEDRVAVLEQPRSRLSRADLLVLGKIWPAIAGKLELGLLSRRTVARGSTRTPPVPLRVVQGGRFVLRVPWIW